MTLQAVGTYVKTGLKQGYDIAAPAGLSCAGALFLKANPIFAAAFTASVIVIRKLADRILGEVKKDTFIIKHDTWKERAVNVAAFAIPSAALVLGLANTYLNVVVFLGIFTAAKAVFKFGHQTLVEAKPYIPGLA